MSTGSHSRPSDRPEKHHRRRNSREREESHNVEDRDRGHEHRHRDEAPAPRIRVKEEPLSPTLSPSRPSTSARDDCVRRSPPRRQNDERRHHQRRDRPAVVPDDGMTSRKRYSPKLRDIKKEVDIKAEPDDAPAEPRRRPKWELDDEEEAKSEEKAVAEKEKPNFEPSGKLAEDTNTFKGIVIKYNEPPDAHKTAEHWRLYPFKGDTGLPILHIHRASAYLIGRETPPADLVVNHPSVSKQHAVLQYRRTPKELADGTVQRVVRPYIIDLDSANGTMLNGERIEARRYYELHASDVLNFGFSTRDFVLLREVSEGKTKKRRKDPSPSASPD